MWFLRPPDYWATKCQNQREKKKKNVFTQRLKPESVSDSPHTLSCNRSPWMTFAIAMVTQQTSGDLSGIPLQYALCEWASVRVGLSCSSSTGEGRKGKSRKEDRPNCGFHCEFVSHKHEGGMGRKILFWDGCYRNIIRRRGGGGVADACRDVSIAMPCVCMDKYHMAQSSLGNNEPCSALLDKVYDSSRWAFSPSFFLEAALNSSSQRWIPLN